MAMVALQTRRIQDPVSFTLALRASIEAQFGDRLAPMAAVERAEACRLHFTSAVDELSPTFYTALAAITDAQRRQQQGRTA